MPRLETAFLQTDRWKKLSAGGKAALSGMLQFAIFKQIEWTIEGSPGQVAEWLGSESGLGKKAIQDGIAELELTGLLRKSRNSGRAAAYVIAAPLVDG